MSRLGYRDIFSQPRTQTITRNCAWIILFLMGNSGSTKRRYSYRCLLPKRFYKWLWNLDLRARRQYIFRVATQSGRLIKRSISLSLPAYSDNQISQQVIGLVIPPILSSYSANHQPSSSRSYLSSVAETLRLNTNISSSSSALSSDHYRFIPGKYRIGGA